jgi:hypothetical protein
MRAIKEEIGSEKNTKVGIVPTDKQQPQPKIAAIQL